MNAEVMNHADHFARILAAEPDRATAVARIFGGDRNGCLACQAVVRTMWLLVYVATGNYR